MKQSCPAGEFTMAKIKIEIDTDSTSPDVMELQPRAPKPLKNLGILASIDLTKAAYDLFTDVEGGYGAKRAGHHMNVQRADLKYKKDDLINNSKSLCRVIATIGGLYVNAGIEGDADNVVFVSLVGKIPTIPDGSKCAGGVSLETAITNGTRRKYLLDNKLHSADRSVIGLFRHKPEPGSQTDVSKYEETEWNDNSTIFDSIGNFDQEFTSIPQKIKALVISASPFFLYQNNMSLLVKAANKWLQDQSRFLVYPLQIYEEAAPTPSAKPASGTKRISLIGPDLHDACYMLGTLARSAQAGATPGFQKRQDATLTSEL
jgi:hypothetical protein